MVGVGEDTWAGLADRFADEAYARPGVRARLRLICTGMIAAGVRLSQA